MKEALVALDQRVNLALADDLATRSCHVQQLIDCCLADWGEPVIVASGPVRCWLAQMIRYTMSCDQEHRFDSWFQSAAAWDRLHAAGLLSCAICGAAAVQKVLMAPAVQGVGLPAPAPLREPANPAEAKLAALRRQIEANSDYVGLSFAAEARAMHEGSMPERAIHGEARPDEARALLADGIPVAPLPFIPRRQTN